jgi:hypothetical protein
MWGRIHINGLSSRRRLPRVTNYKERDILLVDTTTSSSAYPSNAKYETRK